MRLGRKLSRLTGHCPTAAARPEFRRALAFRPVSLRASRLAFHRASHRVFHLVLRLASRLAFLLASHRAFRLAFLRASHRAFLRGCRRVAERKENRLAHELVENRRAEGRWESRRAPVFRTCQIEAARSARGADTRPAMPGWALFPPADPSAMRRRAVNCPASPIFSRPYRPGPKPRAPRLESRRSRRSPFSSQRSRRNFAFAGFAAWQAWQTVVHKTD